MPYTRHAAPALILAALILLLGGILLSAEGLARNGGPGADRLVGKKGPDRLLGGKGNDIISGRKGRDRLFGGPGRDRLNGGRGNDRLSGGAGRDRLYGGMGRDLLKGGRGNDLLHGGPGKDRIVGGPGRDRILARDRRRDVIDCGAGRDTAIVDRFDKVRRCERVLRSKRAGSGPGGSGPGSPAPGGGTPGLPPLPGTDPPVVTPDYARNLALIRAATVRNTNHDASPHRNTPSAQLDPRNHLGPRADYLGNPGGNPEQSFPIPGGGQFRASCEFSHFAYDDPLVHPGKPGAAHLHMFFGNTDVNALSTYASLINSGSSTCNGQELNRTGYWVPAMIDGEGNVRIPERILVYYKGEGRARGLSEVYPKQAAMISTTNLNQLGDDAGGAQDQGKSTYLCSDQFSTNIGEAGETIPPCTGQAAPRTVLEHNVKFPQCWNGQDPSNPDNFRHPQTGSWYFSNCVGAFNRTLPNLEYFVNYPLEPGETTDGWFISSDVTPQGRLPAGSSSHGDWWGGWHPDINQQWIDNCTNFANPDGTPSGCGNGYLTDGGPDNANPGTGPALRYRPQFEGPFKVPGANIVRELCKAPGKAYRVPDDAAHCAMGTGFTP